ncbi:16S rRNA (cytidine1402-2'-O)-methyltransferase [Texcoconibacillus texcoconensis]|uniref:Ribosomal RNA small subunit methyltransferase I n=1 Tax=Texcoconibacillus texcoconensis TaxID=1095777 RepID=A0A840QUG6_9BACI|nr:16S rRNA (cytidine1402-2'-O)-methyltransferase [Texcoconibacillus texcoconensis]
MEQQPVYEQLGTLYLVPTPIGHLQDMTFRAIECLKSATLVACEDTRVTKKLCNHFHIDTPLMSYHEHNKHAREEELIGKLKAGEDIALTSDAGSPAISDPGHELVVSCVNEGISVVPLPGANAVVPALTASGLAPEPFVFLGFLERKKKLKVKQLLSYKNIQASLVIYESPYRVKDTLSTLEEVLGNRQVCLARELTKIHEEFIRGSCQTVREQIEERGGVKGECCLIVEGSDEQADDTSELKSTAWWSEYTLNEHIEQYIESGMTTKDAIKQTSADRNMKKREVYNAYHQ